MATSHSKEKFGQRKTNSVDPSERGTFEVNGHKLYWERYGALHDPCAVLLHHGLGSIRSWRRQIPALLASGWSVLAYDRWGYGRSDQRPAFQYAYLAQDSQEAFALLDHLNINRVALMGHSDGGSIALLMAAAQPERVTALIVIAAHIYFEPCMIEGLEGIARSADDEAFIVALQREHGQRASHLLNAWVRHWRAAEAQSLNMCDRLAAISSPTLVIQGELDEHATPKHAIDIAEGVQQGTLWLIPEVRHMPPHEIPDVFNQKVVEFLVRSGN